MIVSRLLRVVAFVGAASILWAAPAAAFDCVNSSKNPSSPTVIVGAGTGCEDELIVKTGIEQRIDNFGLDENGEPNFQFHGPIGLDFDCDGAADIITYEPGGGTNGVIPAAEKADGQNRQNCTGLTNFETAFDNGCVAS
jgi:hypothetical protein